jgi:hypothetical protein
MTSLAEFRAAFQQRLQDRIDGLCLLCLGGLMSALARSNMYWYFLNPKFSMLTLCAGALLLLVGFVLFLRPLPSQATPGRLWRQAVLLGFLSLAATSWSQAASEQFTGAANPASTDGVALAPEPEAPADPHPVKNGAQYLRLNLAELYIMLDKGRTDLPPRFALRAPVLRTPELDARGHVLVRRTAVVCCLADSLDLGFLVRGDGLEGVKNGEWVEVFGALEPLPASDADLLKLVPKGKGPSLSLTYPKARIRADIIEPTPAPEFPYLFEFRETEPFGW